METGTLYIVSTPIGNLGDITYRACDVLSKVDLIAAEDTRTSRVLLNHYKISTKVTSFHSYNQAKKTPIIIKKLMNNEDIAVITDAGTPGISDPAYYLVNQAIEKNIPIIPAPGASALLAALVVSGLPTNRFVFEGFLPVKKGRRSRLVQLSEEKRTIVLFESRHRLLKTLKELFKYLGNRNLVIARELTKLYEEINRTTIEKAIQTYEQRINKGEFVLVVQGMSK